MAPTPEKSLTPIQEHMLKMFLWLRIGVGVIGLSLPILLVGCGKLVYQVPFAGSMSAYYHATSNCWEPHDPAHPDRDTYCNVPDPAPGEGPLRNWFVGNLFFIGAAMLLMRGFSQWEDAALDVAGVAAPLVALFPMSWGSSFQSPLHLHIVSAVTFFFCAGFTCIFCSGKTLPQLPPNLPNRQKVIARYTAIYKFLGVIMWLAPLCVFFLMSSSWHKGFWLEAAGVSAFGAYWLVKTRELSLSQVERRVLRGELAIERKTLRGQHHVTV